MWVIPPKDGGTEAREDPFPCEREREHSCRAKVAAAGGGSCAKVAVARETARRHHHPAPVPAEASVGQRRVASHGPAARPPRARRVLGLLPRAVAPHAPLPAGLARALRRRRPARRARPLPRL